jgi:GNAT superfamily N-acetyltransferase
MDTELNITSDKTKLDISFVHEFLANRSYWARGRSLSDVEKTIENSLCFGVYTPDGSQIGFARVITDYVAFAWLMDVFIEPGWRGKDIGRRLIHHILSQDSLKGVKGIGLRTEDAHGLYRKFGFNDIPEARTWMYRDHLRGAAN